jgi:hypothetical protein
MVVRGDQWPLLVYAKQMFDPVEPWDGLFRSELLVWVRSHLFPSSLLTTLRAGVQTHLHLAQLSGERGQSDEIRQRSYPWYDPRHTGFLSLRSYAGMNGIQPYPLNIEHLAATLRFVVILSLL